MKRFRLNKIHITSLITAFMLILVFVALDYLFLQDKTSDQVLRIGFVYDGDESTPYSANFIRAQREIENTYGDRVVCDVKSNVSEVEGEQAIRDLAKDGCGLIFTTSYGFGEAAKKLAAEYPQIQFCQATCDNANTEPVLSNYHTFMGEIYEGRYIAGVVAGMKLRDLIDTGQIKAGEAKVGYVGAFPYAEVISGYTAFLLGVRSVAPEAVMYVKYTDSWSDYYKERKYADQLINEGCVIISQHSDTIGPAVACEETDVSHPVFHVGYNQSMIDVAPTTALISTRINWDRYMLAAVNAVLSNKKIEDAVKGHKHGYDTGAGFEQEWVQMMDLNEHIAAPGTANMIKRLVSAFQSGTIEVFKGDYTGTNPSDPSDTIDLSAGYQENANASAPSFYYVLDDVIKVE
ncbi:MAG: BMP family ABC transporter substrate-binding protein [Lachnospiraceae bacterium]|nr:BMP family ABC transporter substrate-binding protein [Lachnospiraceae bacterium]